MSSLQTIVESAPQLKGSIFTVIASQYGKSLEEVSRIFNETKSIDSTILKCSQASSSQNNGREFLG